VAPIFGSQGRLVGVLNVTSMQSAGGAVQSMIRELVTSSARRIENQHFERLHPHSRVLRLSRYNDFLDGAAEARVAIDDSGRIIDATPFARRLLNPGDSAPVLDENKSASIPTRLSIVTKRVANGSLCCSSKARWPG
jgi:transcriptional regulator of acetoin/glycerol metabolism